MKKNNKIERAIKQAEQNTVTSFASVEEMWERLGLNEPSRHKPPKEPKRDYSKPSVKSMYGLFGERKRYKAWA